MWVSNQDECSHKAHISHILISKLCPNESQPNFGILSSLYAPSAGLLSQGRIFQHKDPLGSQAPAFGGLRLFVEPELWVLPLSPILRLCRRGICALEVINSMLPKFEPRRLNHNLLCESAAACKFEKSHITIK
jgi:hypothetical protein